MMQHCGTATFLFAVAVIYCCGIVSAASVKKTRDTVLPQQKHAVPIAEAAADEGRHHGLGLPNPLRGVKKMSNAIAVDIKEQVLQKVPTEYNSSRDEFVHKVSPPVGQNKETLFVRMRHESENASNVQLPQNMGAAVAPPTVLRLNETHGLLRVGSPRPHKDAKEHPYIVPLKFEEVVPPDHVDGLRVEQDGHLNRDYKKEIILGNHEEFERPGGNSKLLSRLKIVFLKADKNHDGYLTNRELKDWIMMKVREHLAEAARENARIFRHLDTDHDGYVTWKEFHIHFLLSKGYNQTDTFEHVEDYDTLKLDPEERERFIRYKFRWADADQDPQDNQLTVEEMRDFRHPEQSASMIGRMAKDIIENLDHNDDKIITEEEFVALPPDEVDGMHRQMDGDEHWQNERRKEFQDIIDLNHDGKVDEAELKVYVNPNNENHAQIEADNLIQLADQNKDGKLTMDEVLENAELFLGSKMVDTGQNFHDEF